MQHSFGCIHINISVVCLTQQCEVSTIVALNSYLITNWSLCIGNKSPVPSIIQSIYVYLFHLIARCVDARPRVG